MISNIDFSELFVRKLIYVFSVMIDSIASISKLTIKSTPNADLGY